ncbi:hypothetical protein B0H66DRAFT_184632 [Apodospora peruviana]|uniref:Peptidase M20 dimerisation domain-containing protein n=1 Tax=Apodospora peruviana TaxID=516989 RepID=A0AAE0M7N6_9PEZI|nr:hypothetical protein B0H66DRAFT_184632 [Apodospora peruviana]
MKSLSRLLLLVGGAALTTAVSRRHHKPLQQQHPLGVSSLPEYSRYSTSDAAPSYRKTLLDLHRNLISIPSVSGNETTVASWLADYLTSQGHTTSLQCVDSPSSNSTMVLAKSSLRCNVVVRSLSSQSSSASPAPHLARVLVSSHIDVVPPYIPYAIDTSDEIGPDTLISGRGSVDAKASVAAQIVAVDQLLASNEIDGDDVMLLFVVGEETTGDGMLSFSSSSDNQKFEAAIFGEPTENKLACGHKGIGLVTVSAQGKAGHSGYPWLGKSATEVLARAIVKILDADFGCSDRFGNTTVNVGRMEGGVAANVIARDAVARLAIRIATGNRTTGVEIVREKLEKILEETDGEALSMEWLPGGYGPIECNCDVDGFETIGVNYGTDVPHLSGDHVSYLYGPGSILVAHGDDEALRVRDLETAVEGYKTLIKHVLKKAD